jgi:hypothetical protein
VHLTVDDDGVSTGPTGGHRLGYGLIGMRERAVLLGGSSDTTQRLGEPEVLLQLLVGQTGHHLEPLEMLRERVGVVAQTDAHTATAGPRRSRSRSHR